MRGAGWALAWEFWALHRWVFGPSLAYLAALVVLVHAVPAGTLGPEVGGLLPPLMFALCYVLAAFTHSHQAKLEDAESLYPRRAFLLPLPTAALAGWPLALGGAVVALFWLALAGLVWPPCGVNAPLLWPAAALVAALAWVQALMWTPFPLPYLRIILALPVLGGLAVAALAGALYEVPPPLLLAASLVLTAAGYALAVAGLARARRGDGAVWRWRRARPLTLPSPPLEGGEGRVRGEVAPPPVAPFWSPERALAWMEWRRGARALPVLCGMLVLPLLVLLFVAAVDARHAVAILGTALGFPVLMAGAAGAAFGHCHHSSRNVFALPPFLAARPAATAMLIAVKLRVAALSTALTWGAILLLLAIAAPLSRAGGELARGWAALVDAQGVRAYLLVAAALVALPALTWKQMVSNFWVTMTGRTWVIYVVALAFWPVGLTVLALAAMWVMKTPERYTAFLAFLSAAPWLLAAAVVLKVVLGVLVAGILRRRGLVAAGTLRRWAVAWLAAAVALFALAFALTPAGAASPLAVGCVAVLLLLPLVRLGLAPLALDWNRHR